MQDVAAAPGKAQQGRLRWRVWLERALVHPLLLLLVGGLLSALVVPMITQRWQDHERALDVQTTLVAEMTEASENMLVAIPNAQQEIIDSTVNAPPATLGPLSKRLPQTQKAIDALNAMHGRWQIRQAVIGSRLRAYYRGTTIPAEWDRLADQLLALLPRAVANAENGNLDEQGVMKIGTFRDSVVQHVLDKTPRV